MRLERSPPNDVEGFAGPAGLKTEEVIFASVSGESRFPNLAIGNLAVQGNRMLLMLMPAHPPRVEGVTMPSSLEGGISFLSTPHTLPVTCVFDEAA